MQILAIRAGVANLLYPSRPHIKVPVLNPAGEAIQRLRPFYLQARFTSNR